MEEHSEKLMDGLGLGPPLTSASLSASSLSSTCPDCLALPAPIVLPPSAPLGAAACHPARPRPLYPPNADANGLGTAAPRAARSPLRR